MSITIQKLAYKLIPLYKNFNTVKVITIGTYNNLPSLSISHFKVSKTSYYNNLIWRKNIYKREDKTVIHEPIKKDGSESVQTVGPVRADPYRSHHSCCKPFDPTRNKSDTQYHHQTNGNKGTRLDPFRYNLGTSEMGQPSSSGPWPIWPGPLRPTHPDPLPAESKRSDPFSIYWTTNHRERESLREKMKKNKRQRFFLLFGWRQYCLCFFGDLVCVCFFFIREEK